MEIVSFIPGRIRVKYINLYKNVDLASHLYNELYSINGIYLVKINVYTGKLLIIYDKSKLSFEELLSKIESLTMIDYESNEEYLTADSLFKAKSKLSHRNQMMDENKSISFSIFNNENFSVFFKPILLISISVALTLLSGQYILISRFLLLMLIYKFISSVLNSFYKKKLSTVFESKPNGEIISNKLNFENSVIKFYDSIIPIIVVIAILYSLSIANYTPLLSIVFLLTFNSLNRSASIVLNSMSRRLHTNGIHLISLNKLDEISNLSTIIIDKTQDTSDLDKAFIEDLREHGFYDIHIFTTNFNIEEQTKSLELTVFRVGDNDLEKIKYIRPLKRRNETIALIVKEPASLKILNEVDISISLSNKLKSINNGPWDLVIDHYSYNTLGETIDYIKYTLEKIYQNQLISLWLNILGIVFSFSNKIKLIYIGLLSIANEILVYLNSLRLLNYEPIYE
ncbi:hypothetical protein R9X47_04435 [Wukongibacter baidiensis]|uniref:HMA2 domain-containing protein n=1 Tax=Wukongibacter baidiensis TaxID=1723361 RepID=UPI003D7F9D62